MKQIRETYRKTGRLHHAYGILGERDKVKEEILSFLLKDLKFTSVNNPDLWQGEFNVLKIDDCREIIDNQQKKPVKFERKFFIISANFITRGAQNSLLKIFEEPAPNTIFFLLMPAGTDLLPTLKSRMIWGKGDTAVSNFSLAKEGKRFDAEAFLDAKLGRRMEMVAKILKDIKDEKINKSDAITFIKNLEKIIKLSLKQKNAHNARNGSLLAIEDLERAISYANDESPSIKVILEHLATTL